MNDVQLFHQHHNLLRAMAWKAARAFRVNFKDALAQSYLIFSQALLTFQEERGLKFSTHLTNQLRRMFSTTGPFAIDYRKRSKTMDWALLEENFEDFTNSYRVPEFKLLVESDLSLEAQMLLGYILDTGIVWDLQDVQAVCKSLFNWAYTTTKAIWNEIKTFWRNFDNSAYAL